MLWRVRANLPDRPGALAAVAHECGRCEVNIGAVQVFRVRAGSAAVELVVTSPDGWQESDVVGLVNRADGDGVVVLPVTEAALEDQPTRYVRAAQEILDHPASFPDIVAHLFYADVTPTGDEDDVLEMSVGKAVVQIRRNPPFTPSERMRGAALAELVTDVLHREGPHAPAGGTGDDPSYVVDGDQLSALVGGRVIGRAGCTNGTAADDPWPVDLWVEPAWQRRGIGTRLLADIARLARSRGADEIVLTAPADSQAVLPMVLAAGLRGRIRMAGETVAVRIAVGELRMR